jgi:hypothetical protein
MDDATYHALARHEHEVKARVYASHGLFRRADSHLDRAAYHASFGAKSKPKKPKEPKVKKVKPKKVKLGLGENPSPWSRPSLDRLARSPDTSDTELDDIPDLVSETYRPEVSRKHSARSGWSRPSLGRIVDDYPPDLVSTKGYVPRTSPKYSGRFMSSMSEW